MLKKILITGATGGLGSSIARELLKFPDTQIFLAVRDLEKGRKLAESLGSRAQVVLLNLESLDEIRSFALHWKEPLFALINNAGIQNASGTEFTKDGYEQTFFVNHLAPTELTLGLWNKLEGGRVLWIGSGTHNPSNKTASVFGFRGSRWVAHPNIESWIRGKNPENVSSSQVAKDRYATSKFFNMILTKELAKRFSATRTTCFCLDPGLMAGTGLARGAALPIRIVWHTLLKAISPMLPDSSTPQRSGSCAANLILSGESADRFHGNIFSFDGQKSRRLSAEIENPEIAADIFNQTLKVLGRESWPESQR